MEKPLKQDVEYVNFIEIRVYGLRRSGNHAIIKWIQEQYSGHITCFLNNVVHGSDPYINFNQSVLTGIDEQIEIETLRKIKKRLLIYSYEDSNYHKMQNTDFLSSVFRPDFEENRISYLGISQHQFDVAIIRDPFNSFASRLTMFQENRSGGSVTDMPLISNNWKIMAKEVINLTKDPKEGKLVINYNRWVTDQNYRENLSKQLKGKFIDSSISKVANFGGGSSFQETNIEKLTIKTLITRWYKILDIRRFAKIGFYWKRLFAPKLNKSVFFERWKVVSDDEKFRILFLDNEIIELSEELFGEIPGTREFVKSLSN